LGKSPFSQYQGCGGRVRVKVKLFGMLRERVGQSALEVEVPNGATASQVWQHLVESHPRLQVADPAVAVNLEYVSPDTVLSEGDEVAFLPPVAGGGGDEV
jgi:molybdopterin converting factor subunit 1